MKKRLLLFIFACAAHGPVFAQANFTFSGGSGSPLTVTLLSPVTYTLTGSGTKFDFFTTNANGFPGLSETTVTGSLTYTINGGAPIAITSASSNIGVLFFWGGAGTGQPGDVFTLNAGSFTTTANFAGPAPSGGTFTTFVADNLLTPISSAGVPGGGAVPEPSTYAAIAGAAALGFAMWRRKRNRPAPATAAAMSPAA